MKSMGISNLLSLLEEKNMPAASRRRLVVTQAALELIEVSLRTDGGNHRLGEEMENLPKYVAAIEALLEGR